MKKSIAYTLLIVIFLTIDAHESTTFFRFSWERSTEETYKQNQDLNFALKHPSVKPQDVKELIEMGADVNREEYDGSPLIVLANACWKYDKNPNELIEKTNLLIKSGANLMEDAARETAVYNSLDIHDPIRLKIKHCGCWEMAQVLVKKALSDRYDTELS